MTDPYETLGVPRDASAEDIKQAYRKSASQNHPDKGGDPEAMQKVNQAYAVLADPARRAQYDQGGGDPEAPSDEGEARTILTNVFAQALQQDGIDSVKFAREWIRRSTAEIGKALEGNRRNIKRLTKRRDKVKTKKGANLMHAIIDRQVAELSNACFTLERQKIVVQLVGAMLDDYESDEVPPPPPAPPAGADPMSGLFYSTFGVRF